ncbi:MAG: hypothetical protein U0234_32890 [Sandaracinus sp.]
MSDRGTGFAESFSDWAVTQATGLHEITELTGTAENWLRGQAILAARRGAFGPYIDITAETGAGRTDLTLLRDGRPSLRVELKLLFNNKNLLGRQNGVAAVAADIEKLKRSVGDECYVAAWCLFRNWHVVPVTRAYCATTSGISLQPPTGEEDFATFAEQLARNVLASVGVRAEPRVFAAFDGCWSGLFVQQVVEPASWQKYDVGHDARS